jgi:hypothetical protein
MKMPMIGVALVAAAGGLFLITGISDSLAAAHCTSIQARCAVEIGGKCDPKTGKWHYGRTTNGWVGGNTQTFQACVERETGRRK